MAEKTLSKEEWARVEKALSGTFGRATLKVDGRTVTFVRTLAGKNRLATWTYVDGKIEGKWMNPKNEHPETRYLRPVEKFAWKPEARKRLKKMPKRYLKELGYNPDEKYHYFELTWPNATAIRRHYQKTFASIELIEVIGC